MVKSASVGRGIFAAIAAISMCVAHAETYTWTGGTGTWDENSGAMWTASDQSTGTVPGENDAAIIPGAAANYTVTVTKPFSVASLEVGSTTAGTAVTLCFKHREENTVSGDVHVRAGATINHTANAAAESYRVALVVGGSMILDENAAVNVTGKGYASQKGPGFPGKSGGPGNVCGAGHGGGGGSAQDSVLCYGSLTCPTSCGSGSQYTSGGGSVRLNVTGSLTVNGDIVADGGSRTSAQFRSGSGGSVWLTCADLIGSGSGILSVAGGSSGYHSGGGGRLAVHLTEGTDFSSWQGIMRAHGGPCSAKNTLVGGAGTIYLQAAGQTPETATVITDNEGAISTTVVGQTHGATYLGDELDAGVIGNLIVANRARVAFLSADETVEIFGDINTTTGEILDYPSTVELAGLATQTIRGNGTWANLSCTVPGKTIKVGTGAGDMLNFRATSVLTLAGSSEANIVLTPETEGETGTINLPAGGEANVSYATVDHSTASGSTITAQNSTDGGDNENWVFPSPMTVGDPVTWTGAVDSNFGNPANWEDKYAEHRLPTKDDKVVVPAGCENNPVISAPGSYWGLVVEAGATLTIAGVQVEITGTNAVSGTLAFSGYPTLAISAPVASFAGATIVPGEGTVRILDGVETFDPDGLAFSRVEIVRSGGTLALGNGLKAKSFEVRATDAATVVFAAGSTVEADAIVCSCTAATDGSYLTLASSDSGEAWFVKSPRISYMTRVNVSDSTASGAKAVASLSVDGGRNTNWSFDNGVSEWVGGTGDFDVAANWYPAVVPGVTNDVILRGAATITANGNVSVRSLTLLPDTSVASLTVKGVLTTAGDALVGTNATLTLSTSSAFNEIGGDFIVCGGGKVTHPALAATATTLADGENGAKVIVRAQNIVIEAGGRIDVKGCGYPANKGPAAKGTFQDEAGNSHSTSAGHAGTVVTTLRGAPTTNDYPVLTGYRAYGSMFEPTTYGSGGDFQAGGGVIRLVATGDVTIEGTVSANGGSTGSDANNSGAGGSIWITAGGSLTGAGIISAAGGEVWFYNAASGGRIAIYAGSDSFTGRIAATGKLVSLNQGDNVNSSVTPAPGTVLVKVADEDGYSLLLDYEDYSSLGGRVAAEGDKFLVRSATDIPTAEDLDKIALFRNVSVTCGHLTVLNLTCDLKLQDLDFTAEGGSKARLNFHNLEIASKTHKKGRGWAVKAGDNPLVAHIWPCENDAGDKGSVAWPSGLAILVK